MVRPAHEEQYFDGDRLGHAGNLSESECMTLSSGNGDQDIQDVEEIHQRGDCPDAPLDGLPPCGRALRHAEALQ